jgi:sigma-B regulation protein RsbU (phosphoserine phosphatase)
VAIADVAGKGMPAALLMANVQAALRSLAPLSLPLSELVLRINNIVYHNTSADKFVSFFCGILDAGERRFSYVNAGHNPPMLLKRSGQMKPLTIGGIVLGVMDTPFPYQQEDINLEPGDVTLFYTDGITEALDENGKEFGETNLEENLRQNSVRNSVFIMNSILEAVQIHTGSQPQGDDLTLVVMKSKDI